MSGLEVISSTKVITRQMLCLALCNSLGFSRRECEVLRTRIDAGLRPVMPTGSKPEGRGWDPNHGLYKAEVVSQFLFNDDKERRTKFDDINWEYLATINDRMACKQAPTEWLNA